MAPLYLVLVYMCVFFVSSSGGEETHELSQADEEDLNEQPLLALCDNSDIVFVLDASGSVGQYNFKKIKSFTKGMIKGFHDAGAHDVQIAVMRYGHANNTEEFIHLNSFKAHDESEKIYEAIDAIPGLQARELTHTANAIGYMRRHSFKPKFGGGGAGRKKIGILVTDGYAKDPQFLSYEIKEASKAGIELIAVGIGNDINREELLMITGGRPHRVLLVEKVEKVYGMIEKLIEVLCAKQCHTVGDVAFVMDATGSMSHQNFHLIKKVMTSVITGIGTVDPTMIQAAVIRFGHVRNTKEVIHFNSYSNKTELFKAINGITHLSEYETTHTAQALALMNLDTFTKEHGARDYAPRAAVVLTDGFAKDRNILQDILQQSNQEGIHIFAVGVGDKVDPQELNTIGDGMYFRIQDYSNVVKVISHVLGHICEYLERKTLAAIKNDIAYSVTDDEWVLSKVVTD